MHSCHLQEHKQGKGLAQVEDLNFFWPDVDRRLVGKMNSDISFPQFWLKINMRGLAKERRSLDLIKAINYKPNDVIAGQHSKFSIHFLCLSQNCVLHSQNKGALKETLFGLLIFSIKFLACISPGNPQKSVHFFIPV